MANGKSKTPPMLSDIERATLYASQQAGWAERHRNAARVNAESEAYLRGYEDAMHEMVRYLENYQHILDRFQIVDNPFADVPFAPEGE